MATISDIKRLTDGRTFFWPHHDCSLCGVDVGYVVTDGQVSFRSACGCSWSPDQHCGPEDILDFINMQKPEVGERLLASLTARALASEAP